MMAASRDGKNVNEDVIVDMMLLLDCLKFQKDCVPLQKQALGTLASMCQENASSRDLFRTSGCLEYVTSLVKTTTSQEVLQGGLYTLASATENNVVSQMKLSDCDIFNLLNKKLSHHQPILLQSSILFLSISLMYSNSQGQNNSRKTKLLHKFVDLFKCGISSMTTTDKVDCSRKFWVNLAQAISVSCDNPQNELNQYVCCSAIPAAVSILDCVYPQEAIKSAIIVIIGCVTNNVKCQGRLKMVGGLKALGKLLHQFSQSNQQSSSSLLLHIVRCICAAISGNDTNTECMSDIKVVPLLLNSLKWIQETDSLLAIVICIEALVENNEVNQQQIIECGGIPLLISLMANTKESALNKVITVLLKNCVIKDNSNLTCTHINNCFDGIIQLTDKGIAQLDTTPPLTHNNHPKNSPILNDNHVVEDFLTQLNSAKLPLDKRVQEWLDHSDHHPTKPVNYNFTPKEKLLQPKVSAISKADTTHAFDMGTPKLTPTETSWPHSAVSEGNIASQIEYFKSCLTQEQMKLSKMQKFLNKMEHSITQEYPNTPTTCNNNNPVITPSIGTRNNQNTSIYKTSHSVQINSSKRNVRVASNSKAHPNLSLHNLKKSTISSSVHDISQSVRISRLKCIGCYGLPGVALNSRTLLPRLRNDPNICRYHRMMVKSINNRTLFDSYSCNAMASLSMNKRAVGMAHMEQQSTSVIKTSPLLLIPSRQTNDESCLTTRCYTREEVENDENFYSKNAMTDNSNSFEDNSPNMLLSFSKPLQTSSPINAIISEKDLSFTKECSDKHQKKYAFKKPKPPKTTAKQFSKISKPLNDITNDDTVSVYDYHTPTRKTSYMYYPKKLQEAMKLKTRKPSLQFTKDEEMFLIEGIKKLGQRWSHILSSYPFQTGRTAGSLKDKYKLLRKKL